MKELSPIKQRMLKSAVHIGQYDPEKHEVTYQHKVLAQTCLPYRNLGDDVTKWVRHGKNTVLLIQAMDVIHPKTGEMVTPGLPYGPKARLLMIYINEQAVLQDSPLIDVEEHMTGFLRDVHGKQLDGRQIRQYKNQMARLASCDFSINVTQTDNRTIVEAGRIVHRFDLWFPKDANQKVLWSSKIQLSEEYFKSLRKYLVPLNRHAVGALSNNAMGLDIYAWLAQRLHHIPEDTQQFVAWQNLKDQFGQGYGQMKNFKRVFRETLSMVLMQYPQAKAHMIEDTNKGYYLDKAAPPVPYRKRLE
jgi:hypothetical protein